MEGQTRADDAVNDQMLTAHVARPLQVKDAANFCDEAQGRD